MAGITTIIYTNGVVVSTYDNGAPCPEYSGELPILHIIFNNMEAAKSSNSLKNAKFYISDDPLNENIIEIKSTNLKYLLKFIIQYVLYANTSDNTSAKEDVDKIISDTLTANTKFDNESKV